jgi:Cu+-exporting ATPase
MCAYYDEVDTPGVRPEEEMTDSKFGALDDPEVGNQLLDFNDGVTSRVTFHIPSMHCAACVWLLEQLYRLNSGVVSSRVDFLHKELTVTFRNEGISLKELAALLASLGYEPSISLEDLSRKERSKIQRDLIMRVGVAGFVFGNTMLLAFPEYLLPAGQSIDPFLANAFRWVMLVLSLPVIFYSARPYLDSAVGGLVRGLVNIDVPISLGVLVLFGRSAWEVISGAGQGYFDSLAGLVFFLLLGRLFQEKTYAALSFERDYTSYFPLSVVRICKNEREESVAVTKLEPGDRIMIRGGELIPADSVLITGNGMIDYSFVTGEADPVKKSTGDVVYAGGRQTGGVLELDVIEKVSRSRLVRLWNHGHFSSDRESRFTQLANRFSKWFTGAVLAIAAVTFAVWAWLGEMSTAVLSVTAVLIVACPCALALATPFTLGNAMRLLARSGLFLKSADIVERLAAITTVVFDKTGTLTSSQARAAVYEGKPLSDHERSAIRAVARSSTHPLSRVIDISLEGISVADLVSRVERDGLGVQGRTREGISVRIGSAEWIGVENEGSTGDSIPRSVAYVEMNGKFVGSFQYAAQWRPGLERFLANLKDRLKLVVLSGDVERDEPALRKTFGPEAELRFRQSPEDKLRKIDSMRANGEMVLMVGDGLNDAGALRAADVGLAVSEDVSRFSPASDGLLDSTAVSKLDGILHYSQSTLSVLRAGFVLSLLYNLAGLSFAATGNLSPLVSAILMPASSISVVLFATGMTRLAWRSLGRDAKRREE